MNLRHLILRQLDKQVLPIKQQDLLIPLPEGWVRTVRKALGMTIAQLAKRLNVNTSRIVKIETSEPEGALTLQSLQAVAKALNCELFYCFIPHGSFESIISEQAKKIAIEQLKRTAHTMSLEDQRVSKEWLNTQIEDITKELLKENWKYLWNE